MEIRLYDKDIIFILSAYFKVSKDAIDVYEDNGISWFAIEPKQCEITIKEV